MKNLTVSAYKFDELSIEAREKAINTLSDINVYSDWSDYLIDEFKRCLHNIGFSNVDVLCSGFYSQGDGLSFTGDFDSSEMLTNGFTPLDSAAINTFVEVMDFKHCYFSVSRNSYSRYCHENTMQIDSDLDSRFDDKLLELCRDIASEFYLMLEKEYDYLTSPDAIIETINCNDYWFDIDGNLI